MKLKAKGWIRYPVTTVEIRDISEEELEAAGLGELVGLEGLEGWGFFKKIGRAFKKVGKAIKKFKFKKLFKIAVPFIPGVGQVLAPLMALPVGKLISRFGTHAAQMIRQKRTNFQKIIMPNGSIKIALLTSDEAISMKRHFSPYGQPVALEKLAIVTKRSIEDAKRLIVDWPIKNGKVQIPVEGKTEVSKVEDISKPKDKTMLFLIAGGLAALLLGGRRGRR